MFYHIFTHNHDEYTKDLTEAKEIFVSFIKDYDCARLYQLENEDDNGTCLDSHGVYPQ